MIWSGRREHLIQLTLKSKLKDEKTLFVRSHVIEPRNGILEFQRPDDGFLATLRWIDKGVPAIHRNGSVSSASARKAWGMTGELHGTSTGIHALTSLQLRLLPFI